MSKFYSLKVKEIKRLTLDSVEIVFNNKYPSDFSFKAGQYITLRKQINNEDVRRSYSLSSSPNSGIEIGVKRIEKGLMSTFLTKELKVGDTLDVMPPTGNFYLDSSKENKHYIAICAGSGITPILSMIRYITETEPNTYFTLIYGNRSRSSTMFAQELLELENNFQSQIFIHYIFSRENVSDFIYGRIDDSILNNLFENNKKLVSADSYFLCGPGEMIDTVSSFLIGQGVKEDKINFERFTANINQEKNKDILQKSEELVSNVMISVDGDDFEFELSSQGKTILEAAMDEGADVPFSCKGGVCCVCKAKVMKGKVSMDANYSLSEDEVEAGYILTCQSHPASEDLVVDFDEI